MAYKSSNTMSGKSASKRKAEEDLVLDSRMNDESNLGLQLKVIESNPANTTDSSASEDEMISLPDLKNRKRKKILKGRKSHEVREILKTDSFKFSQEVGLVAKAVKCSCNADMILNSRRRAHDIFVWRCRKNGHSAVLTIRKGSFFEQSRLSMYDILWMVYMWLYEYSIESMMHESDHTYKTIAEWCTSCVHMCREILELKSNPVGGDQKTVEIFECNFKKNKNGGKSSEKWVLCSLEYDGTNTLLVVMEDRTSESIRQVFDKYILPGTKVVSYVWSAFKKLTSDDFKYLMNDRSISFYNLWSKMKIGTFLDFEFVANQPMAGTYLWHKSVYEESFFEKMYRKSLECSPDAYLAFLKDIALVCKPTDRYIKNPSNADDK